MVSWMSSPVENAGSAAIDTHVTIECMIKGSRQNEGSLDHNKDEFDKNFDEIKFPKKPVSSKEKREAAQKDFLRRVLTKTYGSYKGLEEDVEKAFVRNMGLDY